MQKSKALTLFSNRKRFLTNEITNELTFEQVLKSGAHFTLLKKWNEKEIIVCITQMLSEFLMLQKNTMSSEQIVYMAESIIIDFDLLHPDDLLLILINGKKGKYEKEWGNFSYAMLTQWVNVYLKERDDFIYNKHISSVEKNNVTEENKHSIFRERQGKTNETISLKEYKSCDKVSDEKYFGITAEEIKNRTKK